MPANQKVSVGWQIVFTFIPFVNFWAFYRIRKLRKYVLYVVVPVIVILVIMTTLYLDDAYYLFERTTQIDIDMIHVDRFYPPYYFETRGLVAIGLQGFAIYLVIIWSRQHNQSFDTPPTQT